MTPTMRTCLVIRDFHRGASEAFDPVPALLRRTLRALAARGDELHVLTTTVRLPDELRAEINQVARVHEVDYAGDAALDAYPCEVMRHAMGVHRTLRRLHAQTPFDQIHFPAPDGEAYFTMRAVRSLDEFAGVTMSVAVQSPPVVRRFLDRRLATTNEQAFADHTEWAAMAESDVLVAQTRDQFEALDAAADAAGWLDRIRTPQRVITGPVLDASLVAERTSLDESKRPVVLAFGPLRLSSEVHTLIAAAQRLLAGGTDLDVRFVGADLDEGPFDRRMTNWLGRKIGAAWAERFHFVAPPVPGPTGFDAPDASGISGILKDDVRVVCFAGVGAECPAAAGEALAAGACVVAVEGSPAGELIEHERTGLIVPAGDSDALAAALRRVLSDPTLAQRLGGAARSETVGRPSVDPLPGVKPIERPARRVTKTRPDAPRVTVLIPYYNLGAWLPDTLRSVRAQTFTDYEILVVDDGSTDAASLALLDHLPEQGIRVVRRINGGLSACRNTGFAEARADLVLALDADDLIHPQYLEKTVAVFDRDWTGRLAAVSSPIKLFQESPDKPMSGWIPLGFDRELLAFVNVGATASCLMRREAVLGVGGYDEHYVGYEDWDMWCTLAGAGYTASIVPEYLFYYRVRDDGIFRQYCAGSNHFHYKSYLLHKHAGLPTRPSLIARLALGHIRAQQERGDWLEGELNAARARVADLENQLAGKVTFEQAADRMRRENIRYRVVDRLNDAVKSSGLHAPVKSMARRITGHGGS